MKKLLAIILSVICTVSCFALPVNAAGGGVVGEVATDFFERLLGMEVEEDTMIGYGVFYEMETLSGVSIVYKPSPSITFNNPGTYTITSDTPLSVDYEFVCWEDSEGNSYYAGDKLYVDGQVTLYAQWVEKKDNDVRVVRILKTTIEALRRLIGKFLGVFDTVVEFNENYVPTDPTAPRYYDITLNNMYYENDVQETERILIYMESVGYYSRGMKRIELTGNEKAKIYLCTGWDEVTSEPLDKVEFECSYTFSEVQAANKSDVIIIDMTTFDVEAYADEYVEDGANYYMIVSVNECLYSLESGDINPYSEYTNPIACAFTLTK